MISRFLVSALQPSTNTTHSDDVYVISRYIWQPQQVDQRQLSQIYDDSTPKIDSSKPAAEASDHYCATYISAE